METNSSTSTGSNSCAVCGVPCSQSCSSCNKISYCSKEHQKTHWKTHKPDCFPAQISHNSTVGRYLVATRYIKQGEIILKEKPLVSGPHCGASYEKYHPLCLGCYRIVLSNYSCTRCKWPMCGPQCETMKNHSQNECQIFSKQKVAPFSANESFMYEKIIILRALLCKVADSRTWAKVADLESHSTERKQNIKGILLAQSAVEFIQEVCGLRQFTDEEIDQVIGALATNAFWNNDNTSNMDIFRSGSYLYFYGSMPAHNCIPNSAWTVQMNSEFHLRASVDIPAGESITQLYTEATLGTAQRRAHLEETKYFECTCTRCLDSTELGTYFSALKCPECPRGYLLPESPLNEDSDWICQSADDGGGSTVTCGKSKPRKYAEDLLNDIRERINLVNDVDDSNERSSLGAISSLRKLLTTYTTKVLHPNNFLAYEIENIIIQRISYLLAKHSSSTNDHRISPELVELSTLMVELCRKVVRTTDVFLPGFTTHRGRLLYFLQQGLTTSLFGMLSKRTRKRNAKTNIIMQGEGEALDEVERLRAEARRILSNEPEGREEALLHKFLSEQPEKLKLIYKFFSINEKS